MIELTREVEIPAAPPQVWNVLVDFSGYSKWNPYVAMRGVAELGSEIEWSLGSKVLKRRVWSAGVVTEWDRPNRLTWTVGSRRLFLVNERFSLEKIPQGTRLHHSVILSGLSVVLGRRILEKRLTRIMSAIDESLRRHLSRHSAASGSGRPRGGQTRSSNHKSRRRTK